MRVAPQITLTAEQRGTLQRWARGRTTPMRLVRRAQIVLLAAEGQQNLAIAEQLGVERTIVGRWRQRFVSQGLPGLEKDAPRGGRPADTALARRIVEHTTRCQPPNATHWSTTSLAKALGTSPSTVSRVWRANGLKPHLARTFKLSNDPQFVDKLIDVVGLYLNPPERALVFCVDEKSQIQALDRTQPGLPLKKGRCGTMTHDYVRHGTTTLFAALNVAEGKLIGTCLPRHRHQEFIRFLRLIDQQAPGELDLHLIVDNYATHKHPRVKSWLQRHRRFHLHFTPTSSSWLNLVERWFREITDKRIRRGVFRSVKELVAAIDEYVAKHNENPQSFTWTAQTDAILEKVRRARAVLDKMQTA